jgi:hypothetical protein
MQLISNVKTVTNKRLLIFESRGDSNRCTPYRGKPDQHVTCFSCSIRVWSSTIRISRGPRIANFRESSTGLDGCTASEKKCSRLHLSARLSGPCDMPQFFSQHNHWSSVLKLSTFWRQATTLTGPISPACDRYVQYLLARANPSVLNRHRRWLQPWRCKLATSHSAIFPTDGPPLFT